MFEMNQDGKGISTWDSGLTGRNEDLTNTFSPVPVNTVDSYAPGDVSIPHIYDVIGMTVNGIAVLVISDYKNMCIKSFYHKDSKPHHSKLKLTNSPGRIARLEDDKIVVAFPSSREIATVSVTPDLSLVSYINTCRNYCGLTVLSPTTLAAGSHSPPCVDILDRSGNVLHSISPLLNKQVSMQFPNFLHSTKEGNILVSDSGIRSVLCLTPQGDTVFNYFPTGDRALKCPTGITVTKSGAILFAEFYSHKLIQLSESGQFVRDILTESDGLHFPFGLHLGGNLLVTKDNQFIQVFTLR